MGRRKPSPTGKVKSREVMRLGLPLATDAGSAAGGGAVFRCAHEGQSRDTATMLFRRRAGGRLCRAVRVSRTSGRAEPSTSASAQPCRQLWNGSGRCAPRLSEADLADGEAGLRSVVALDDHAFEGLHAFLVAFLDLYVDAHRVAGAEFRDVGAFRFCQQFFDD